MSLLNLSEVTFSWDGSILLDQIDLDLSHGEHVGLLGRNGCGKSTLLKIASGLLKNTAGQVSIDRERIGYVFQDATLLHWRTVL
ncbi:MAG: ATP-binding cassette domain-containing protein, partial [Gammaproteobacteria bacterium]|nr:ATP-binding cassette domain-containing protein [Gammaproteobacteria bacterium]